MSKFAALTAGLLARKGDAEPVVTPFADQLLTRVGPPMAGLSVGGPMAHPHVHSHVEPVVSAKPPAPAPLNDRVTSIFGTFGQRSAQAIALARQEPAREIAKAPVAPGVHVHDDEEHAENHCGACVGPVPEEAGKTYHVNLRLKRLRFVKLKLSAALLRRPVQDVVGEALDAWFDRLPSDVMGDCACLKARGE